MSPLPERDQTPVDAVVRAHDAILVQRSGALYRLDAKALRPIRVAAGAGSLQVFGLEDGAAVVLSSDALYLSAPSTDDALTWSPRTLPDALRERDLSGLHVAGRADDLLLFDRSTLWRLRGEEATTTSLAPRPKHPALLGAPRHALTDGDGGLLLGFARGEWGGALLRVDLASGDVEDVSPELPELGYDLPVTALHRADDGALYMTRGLAHLGLRTGALLRRGPDPEDAWERLAFTDAHADDHGWSHRATSFEGLDLDDDGRLHLLTAGLGVLRREADGSFTRLTPSWPEEETRILYADHLLIDGDTALISAYDAGLLLWDLGEDAWSRPATEAP